MGLAAVPATLRKLTARRGSSPLTRQPADPGAALFSHVRIRLTLWYSGILAVALIASGLVLYFGLQSLSLTPIQQDLRTQASFRAAEWLRNPSRACGQPGSGPGGPGGPAEGLPPPPAPPTSPTVVAPLPIYVACFDPQGTLLRSTTIGFGQSASAPETFLEAPLIKRTLQDGAAEDVIECGEQIGQCYRVATIIRDAKTGSPLGVVQVGRSVEPQIDTLRVVRTLLGLLALFATLGAVAGGLFLANRALEPARWAFARQQAFIADASHQLRTPLTLLRADAEVLLRHRDRLDPDDAELLDDIVDETAHMDRLATNLLTLARLDAHSQHLEHDLVDLSAVAAELAHRVTTLATEKGLTLQLELGEGVELVGDAHLLEQAALTLVENALKYTPAGGSLTLHTARTEGLATLVVEDTGPGIPAEHLRRLGERFYRVDPARSRSVGGAGLGLAIAFGIAQAHGGTVQLANLEPHGLRATLSLPVAGAKR